MTALFLAGLLTFGCGTKVHYDGDTGGSDAGSAPVDADVDGFDSSEDCNDANPAINPAAAEVCDGVDNDCDGAIDEGLLLSFYVDGDGDGYGDPLAVVEVCEVTDGLADNPDDCDDEDPAVNPGADELCNDIDDDCDEQVDEDDAVDAGTWYQDWDGDGYGDDDVSTRACDPPDLYIDVGGDCDDHDGDRSPGLPELCNGIDDDCDENVDEADAEDAPTWYRDRDGDDYGTTESTKVQCAEPDGYALEQGDCDDHDIDVHPGAEEICNGVDDDCDESTLEDGIVTFLGEDGTVADVTSYFAEGTYAAPGAWDLNADGEFWFCQGDWYNSLVISADVSVIGVHGSGETTLSAGDQRTVITVRDTGVDAVVEGFTIRDGVGSGAVFGGHTYLGGGGVFCGANANFSGTDLVISDSSADIGGGVYVEGCDVSLQSSEITDSVADFGGAVAVTDGSMTLSDTLVHANIATNSGGAAYIDGTGDYTANLTVGYSVIQDNEAVYGGGTAAFDASATCVGDTKSAVGYFDNVGTYGGAAYLSGTNFRSNGCDWGTGSTDNAPEDIYIDPYAGSYDFDDDVDFLCTEITCE